MLSAAHTRPVCGALVSVPFTARGTQYAVVLGYTDAGRMKVRAYNATQGTWGDTLRTIHPDDFSRVFPVSWAAAGLNRAAYEACDPVTRRPVRPARAVFRTSRVGPDPRFTRLASRDKASH